MEADVWTHREGVARLSDDMAGYKVEARDGTVGIVDRVSYSGSCLFASAGHIRKHRYAIPAGAVERIAPENRSVSLAVTKEDVEKSPPCDGPGGFDDECERKTGTYYADLLARRDAEVSPARGN